MNVNFELYKVFYHVAKELSFTRAADILFVTQSAVSQSIKQLEAQLGVLLFLRNRRNMQLTFAGKLLFQQVASAYHFLKIGERNIENTKDLQSGEVHVAVSDTICRYFLLDYIHIFHNTYKGIHFCITNQPSASTLDDISKGKIDLGIVTLPENKDLLKNVDLQEVGKFQDVAIAGGEYVARLSGQVSLGQLCRCPLITLSSKTNTRRFLDAFFAVHGENLHPQFELENIELIKEFVRMGLGVGFALSEAIACTEKDLQVLDLKEVFPSRPLYVATPAHRTPMNPVRQFVAMLSASPR